MNLKIIVTVYNAEQYIESCLYSLQSQTMGEFSVIIIDDCSTDKTFEVAQNLVGSDKRFTIVRNSSNKGAIANYVENIPLLCNDDSDIIISLDGDDWLFVNDALEYIYNLYYHDKNLQLTYGQYCCSSDIKAGNLIKGGSRPLENIKDAIQLGRNFSHLKSWSFGLWKKIKDEDLRRPTGEYIKGAWDTTIMQPMIFNCTLENIKYVDRVIYIYNNNNPLSEFRKPETINGVHFQEWEDAYIREKWKKRHAEK